MKNLQYKNILVYKNFVREVNPIDLKSLIIDNNRLYVSYNFEDKYGSLKIIGEANAYVKDNALYADLMFYPNSCKNILAFNMSKCIVVYALETLTPAVSVLFKKLEGYKIIEISMVFHNVDPDIKSLGAQAAANSKLNHA